MVEAYRAEMEAYGTERRDVGKVDEDEEVDVGGVSELFPSPRKIALSLASSRVVESPQKPTLTSTPAKVRPGARLAETIAQRLHRIAIDLDVGLSLVQAHFKQEIMSGEDEDEALLNTREHVEQYVEDRSKRKARKG